MATSGQRLCTICEFRQQTNTATVWCPECEDALCIGCQDHHSISKASRGHVTISVEDYQKLPSFILNIKLFCEEHNEKYQNYCVTHEKPLCKKCIVSTHKDCKETKTLDDIVGNVKSSVAMGFVEQNVEDVLTNVKQIIKERETNMNKINEQKKSIMQKVKRVRAQVNRYLDEIEKVTLEKLSSTTEETEKSINSVLNAMKRKEHKLEEMKSSTNQIKKYASDFQTFIGIKEMENRVAEEQNYVQSVFDKGNLRQVEISCEIDEKLINIQKVLPKFGDIATTSKASTLAIKNSADQQAQIPTHCETSKPITDLIMKVHSKIVVGKNKQIETTGCCIMPNGDVVFACYVSNVLAIHAENGSFKYSIPLRYQAFDVTAIDTKTVAVTVGFSKRILLVDIESKNVLKTVDVSKPCFGITNHKGLLIFCVDKLGLQSMSLQDYKITTIYEEQLSFGSFVVTLGDNICFTNNNIVTVLDSKHKVLWQVQDKTVLKDCSGITKDEKGNLYVADREANKIVVISPDGKQLSNLQCTDSTNKTLYGLVYRKNKKQLIAVRNREEAIVLDIF